MQNNTLLDIKYVATGYSKNSLLFTNSSFWKESSTFSLLLKESQLSLRCSEPCKSWPYKYAQHPLVRCKLHILSNTGAVAEFFSSPHKTHLKFINFSSDFSSYTFATYWLSLRPASKQIPKHHLSPNHGTFKDKITFCTLIILEFLWLLLIPRAKHMRNSHMPSVKKVQY